MNYRITLDKWGGEYCVGSIPRETMDYWSERDEDELDKLVKKTFSKLSIT
jgi:hypothetical protein